MASIAYSTWKRRPSGENVFTPLKDIIKPHTVKLLNFLNLSLRESFLLNFHFYLMLMLTGYLDPLAPMVIPGN